MRNIFLKNMCTYDKILYFSIRVCSNFETDRQTDGAEIIHHAASRVVKHYNTM